MPEFHNYYQTIPGGRETPVCNVASLKRHLNYLLRLDKQQKWTNDDTARCWISFPAVDSQGVFLFEDLPQRKQMGHVFMNILRAILTGDENAKLEDEDVNGFLYTFKVIWTDEHDNIVNQPFGTEELDQLTHRFDCCDDAILLSVVCHKDEPESGEHLHGMFLWLPGDTNRMDIILTSPEPDEIEDTGEDAEGTEDEEAIDDEDGFDINADVDEGFIKDFEKERNDMEDGDEKEGAGETDSEDSPG